MCGIAGIIHRGEREQATEIVHRMVRALRHRGPDSDGVRAWRMGDWTVGLGATRLAIMDRTHAGDQPMETEDGRVAVAYNGELYNAADLRTEFPRRRWRSGTDTEVALEIFAARGEEAFRRFRGMFAAAFWDNTRGALTLVRDPFGMKPLYYATDADGNFLFASEVRALLASGRIPRTASPQGIAAYLAYGSVVHPHTMVRNVHSLHPGGTLTASPHGRTVSLSRAQPMQIADAPDTRDAPSYPGAVRTLRALLEDSVQRHLASDAPLGVFLSGGIDSSAIVALASRGGKYRPRTYTVAYGPTGDADRDGARAVANAYATDHHEIVLTGDRMPRMVSEAIAAMDEPTVDGINTYILSKAVRETGVRVALSGVGGDEVFAGYRSFHRAAYLPAVQRVPAAIRQAVAGWGRATLGGSTRRSKAWSLLESDMRPLALYAVSRQLFPVFERHMLFDMTDTPMEIVDEIPTGDRVNALSLYQLRGYLANTLLRDADAMSMAHGLELRAPFVDMPLVTYVLRLPGSWKIDPSRQKPLLADAVRGLLPREVWQRPKTGFTLPFDAWMRSTLRADINATLNEGDTFSRLGIHAAAVKDLWASFLRFPHRRGEWSGLWAVYVLARWCMHHRVWV